MIKYSLKEINLGLQFEINLIWNISNLAYWLIHSIKNFVSYFSASTSFKIINTIQTQNWVVTPAYISRFLRYKLLLSLFLPTVAR